MKLCFLGSAESEHIQRWVKYFHAKGDKVSLITFSEYNFPGVDVYYITPASKSGLGKAVFFLQNIQRVKRLIHKINPDILHAFYLTSYGLFGALSGFHPFAVTAVGTDILIEPKKSIFFRWIAGYVLRKADLVTSMAKHMNKVLIDSGVPEEKIILLPFGISLSEFNPALRATQPPRNHPVILSTRYMTPIHNVGLLIRAVPEILKEIPDAEIILIGRGSMEEELKKLTGDLGVNKNVKFLGSKPHSEIPKYMSSCDVLVSTAVSDGNNVSLNEAMACGAFPVVTDIPANREWIEDGVSGFLVPTSGPSYLARKIIDAVKNPAFRQKAAEINIKIIKERAIWENNMEKLSQRYKVLL